jgi:hypothetical protein
LNQSMPQAHRLEHGALPQLLRRSPVVAGLGHVRLAYQRIPKVVAAHPHYHGLRAERAAAPAFKAGYGRLRLGGLGKRMVA